MRYLCMQPGLFESTSREAGEITEILDPGVAKRLLEAGAIRPLDDAPPAPHPVSEPPPLVLPSLNIPEKQLDILRAAGLHSLDQITEAALTAIPQLKPAVRASILAAVEAARAA